MITSSPLFAMGIKVIGLTAIAFILLIITQTPASAQIRDNEDFGAEALDGIVPDIAPDGTFQNLDDGIRVKVPQGWTVKDVDNNDPIIMRAEQMVGFRSLATLCSDHTPGLGGLKECNITSDTTEVNILELSDLQELPEVQNLTTSQNKTITIQDFALIYKENILGESATSQELTPIKQTPMQINVTNAEGTTIATTEGLLVQWQSESLGSTLYTLLVLSPEKNTGYALVLQGPTGLRMQATITPEVQSIFDSFELVVPAATTGTGTD